MADIEDQVITAIQSYLPLGSAGGLGLAAVAEGLAAHLVEELGLHQEFGIVNVYTYPRHDSDGNLLEPKEEIDCVTHVADSPDEPVAELEDQRAYERSFKFTYPNRRQYIGSRIFTEWSEEKDSPLDENLVKLAAEDQ